MKVPQPIFQRSSCGQHLKEWARGFVLTNGSPAATTLQRVGERFRTEKQILHSNNTPKSGREDPHCPIGHRSQRPEQLGGGYHETNTFSKPSTDKSFKAHTPQLNCPEENGAYLVQRVEEKLLVHGSSTATTLQRVGERFRTDRRIHYCNNTPKSGREVRTVPSGAPTADTSTIS